MGAVLTETQAPLGSASFFRAEVSMNKRVIRLVILIAAMTIGAMLSASGKPPKKRRLLYLTLSAGYKHASVALSRDVVKEIGEKSGAFETTVHGADQRPGAHVGHVHAFGGGCDRAGLAQGIQQFHLARPQGNLAAKENPQTRAYLRFAHIQRRL